MCHFDEKLKNIFSVFLCYIEWQQKRSYLLGEISLQIKKVERKVWILRNYWVREIYFLFLLTTLFTFSKVSVFIFNKKFPPHKFAPRKTLVSLFYVTVHLILIMLFRNALNHAVEFKENKTKQHNKRGHWKKRRWIKIKHRSITI